MQVVEFVRLFTPSERFASGTADFAVAQRLVCSEYSSRVAIVQIQSGWRGDMRLSEKMIDSPSNLLEPLRKNLTPMKLALLLCWAAAVVCIGGFAAGLAIVEFGTLGALSLWPVGEAAGFVGRKLVPEKSKLAGVILVVACVGAFVLAETCWIHWDTVQGEASWLASIRLLPAFVQERPRAAVFGCFFCVIGANSAYRRVARRYRIVHVVED